jgi:hypothetical protein
LTARVVNPPMDALLTRGAAEGTWVAWRPDPDDWQKRVPHPLGEEEQAWLDAWIILSELKGPISCRTTWPREIEEVLRLETDRKKVVDLLIEHAPSAMLIFTEAHL